MSTYRWDRSVFAGPLSHLIPKIALQSSFFSAYIPCTAKDEPEPQNRQARNAEIHQLLLTKCWD